jgi:hypothetical protein
MATQNASKWGYVRVTTQPSHTAARNATTGQASSNPSSAVANSFSYVAFNSGRGLAYSIYRTFIYIDTSGITGTVTAASINVKGNTNGGSRAILTPSTAFSGDGSTNLAGDDFDNLDFNTDYASSFTTWNTSTNNSITLASTALSHIQNNDYFICALIDHDHDYSNSDPGTATSEIWGVGFATTPYLDYTESTPSGPTNISLLSGVAKANISKVNNITYSGIDAISGVF